MVSIPPKTGAQSVIQKSSLRDCDSFLFSSAFVFFCHCHPPFIFLRPLRLSLSLFSCHCKSIKLTASQVKSKRKPVSTIKQAKEKGLVCVSSSLSTFPRATENLSIFQHHHTNSYQHVHFYNLFSILNSNKRNIYLWFGKLRVRQSASGKKSGRETLKHKNF